MTPVWLDEARRPVPTYPCRVCGRGTPLHRIHGRHLWAAAGWAPFRVEAHPSWCGHPSVTVLLPDGRGWWREVPVSDPSGPLDTLVTHK